MSNVTRIDRNRPRGNVGPRGVHRSRGVSFRNPFATDSPRVTALAAITLALMFVGLVMVLSASSVVSGLQNDGNFFHDATVQASGALIGTVGGLFAARLPLSFWYQWRNVGVIAFGSLQALVIFTPLGESYGGNRNWLNLGFASVQPSEFLKLAIIVWFASWFHENEDWADVPLRYWTQPAIWVGAPIVMVILGGDLGTTIVMGLIVLGMMAFAGVPARTIVALAGLLAGAAMFLIMVGSSSRKDRFLTWISGCSPQDYESICWQTMHSLWALSAGGIGGLGLGESRAKWSWLPHADSDYIFAIIGEELGLIGAVFVLVLILVLGIILIRLIREFPQPLTRVLIGGVFVWIVGQSLINIAVVLNVLPVLGVPLPFISSGGSALLANLLAIGVVMSCVRYEEKFG